jgi:signal transduction histidine kinase
MYSGLPSAEDARFPRAGHNGGVAGRVGWLVAFFRRAEPRGPAPSGWALAFDAAVAVGAAAGAVYEMAERAITQTVILPAPAVNGPLGGVLRPDGEKGGVLFFPAGPATHASAALLILAALTALPLAARRLYPITVWLAIAAAIVLVHHYYVPPVALGTAVYAAYSAVTHSKYRNLAIAVVAVVTIAVAATLGPDLPRFPGRLTAIFAILPAAVAGLGIRELRRRLADSTARLRRATADAEAATRRALAAERARIASELHDVVSHNVSVMIVQAGGARKIMASSPADAEDALLAVEATGREAMTELRNLLGLLSPAADGRESGSGGNSPEAGVAGVEGVGSPADAGTAATGAAADAGSRPGSGPAALRPQPGLGELDALIGRVSAAGLPVELRVRGEPRPLSQGADLAAYRVVQEGLTNVLRHAGGAAASVGVEWGEELVITVSDDGGGSEPGCSDGNGTPGRGLLGLRERLGLYGGELAAGPRPGGGWQVRAVMPAGTAS